MSHRRSASSSVRGEKSAGPAAAIWCGCITASSCASTCCGPVGRARTVVSVVIVIAPVARDSAGRGLGKSERDVVVGDDRLGVLRGGGDREVARGACVLQLLVVAPLFGG